MSAPRTKGMRRGLGAKEDTREHVAKEGSKERAKESGRLTGTMHKDILIGTNRKKPGSIGSVTKEETGNVIDQEGFDLVKRGRVLGNFCRIFSPSIGPSIMEQKLSRDQRFHRPRDQGWE